MASKKKTAKKTAARKWVSDPERQAAYRARLKKKYPLEFRAPVTKSEFNKLTKFLNDLRKVAAKKKRAAKKKPDQE